MDLSQTKLTKSEWVSTEIPVSDNEKQILQLILDGYDCPTIKQNSNLSLIGYMKIAPTPEMEYYLYKTHFEPWLQKAIAPTAPSSSKKPAKTPLPDRLLPKYAEAVNTWFQEIKTQKIKTPNKADMIRLQRVDQTIKVNQSHMFEFLLLDTCVSLIQQDDAASLYSLLMFQQSSIRHLNPYVSRFAERMIRIADPTHREKRIQVVQHAASIIEQNTRLIQFQDHTLYSHQRDLFQIFSAPTPKKGPPLSRLVLYTAPTGTGKTLSPIGLSVKYRVLFVCVARHVGLALAKCAISMQKKVAFAFGCETASDIRLHYFAAADYTIHRKSGGIGKVDNANGSKVEIMICDVASYPVAMYYMKAFHPLEEMVLYWDEPTISLDQAEHELHPLIGQIWAKNQVPNVVLSCATLPKLSELGPLVHSFQSMFPNAQVHCIDSYDCKKSITILNKEGKQVLPHLLFSSYRDILDCVDHCESNKTLLRYFDVGEVVRFLMYVQDMPNVPRIEDRFAHVSEITLLSIKLYYLDVLRCVDSDQWTAIHDALRQTLPVRTHLRKVNDVQGKDIRKTQSVATPSLTPSYTLTRTVSMSPASVSTQSPAANPTQGMLLTTADAHTLTDGPTIFLAEDVDKIGKFYIQQSNIPEQVFRVIQEKIDRNNTVNRQIASLEKEVEDKMASTTKDEYSKKAEKEPMSKEVQRLMERVSQLREHIQSIHLSPAYIPNTRAHQDIWIPPVYQHVPNAFVSQIDEQDVKDIMSLNGTSDQQKMLLIMGIGVFSLDADKSYMEIMKRLAYSQRLFLIIASSDYIYGTNYQFCHGFIGKDLVNMTQQKTIQAIGRIGRNNIQQEYTVRFRDEQVLMRLFRKVERNMEAENMCRLFCSE